MPPLDLGRLISELDDAAVQGGASPAAEPAAWKLRRAARAVLLHEGGIALLHVAKEGYWKLPGGGVEAGETAAEALARECVEEAGARIEIGREIGACIERRQSHGLLQLSYCYEARVLESLGGPRFTKEELEGGFELAWLEPRQALARVEASRPEAYVGRFIVARDAAILRAWLAGRGLRDIAPQPAQRGAGAWSIREALPGDAAEIASLAGELGYPTKAEAAAARLAELALRGAERFRVAVDPAGRILGWSSLEEVRRIYHEPFLEVTGLVVEAASRGRGIGTALMDDAESLAAALGIGLLRLKSNATRAEAHRFYEGLGFLKTKTQYAFQKAISPRSTD
jgi:8-oxo-dGTP pyrophosphatase MutT (NUDIX family)/GNAT superfamily N-acetyltransferase